MQANLFRQRACGPKMLDLDRCRVCSTACRVFINSLSCFNHISSPTQIPLPWTLCITGRYYYFYPNALSTPYTGDCPM